MKKLAVPVKPSSMDRVPPQQAGQNPQGDAEVQAASGLDHGDHGQHQNSIPAEAVDYVADLHPQVGAHNGGHNKQQQHKPGDNQPGRSKAFDHALDAAFSL